MKFKVNATKVRSLAKTRGVHVVHALNSILKHKSKSLGRLYVDGVKTGLKGTSRLTRKDFIRARDYKSYLSGFVNGRRLNKVFLQTDAVKTGTTNLGSN